jgi:hypothetical protein
MVGASDIDSSSGCSTSSFNNSDDDNKHKNKKASKNVSSLICFGRENGFCGMDHNSGSKKSQKNDTDLDSKDEVQ